jgi:hypothetical protein
MVAGIYLALVEHIDEAILIFKASYPPQSTN